MQQESSATESVAERCVLQCCAFTLRWAQAHGWRPDEADDLAQEVAYRLLKWPSARGYGRGRWLEQVIRQCAAQLRADPPPTPLPDAEDLGVEPQRTDPLAWELLAASLRRLTLSEQIALQLCDEEGLTAAEAARFLNLKPSHVHVLCHRARSKLRPLLAARREDFS